MRRPSYWFHEAYSYMTLLSEESSICSVSTVPLPLRSVIVMSVLVDNVTLAFSEMVMTLISACVDELSEMMVSTN